MPKGSAICPKSGLREQIEDFSAPAPRFGVHSHTKSVAVSRSGRGDTIHQEGLVERAVTVLIDLDLPRPGIARLGVSATAEGSGADLGEAADLKPRDEAVVVGAAKCYVRAGRAIQTIPPLRPKEHIVTVAIDEAIVPAPTILIVTMRTAE